MSLWRGCRGSSPRDREQLSLPRSRPPGPSRPRAASGRCLSTWRSFRCRGGEFCWVFWENAEFWCIHRFSHLACAVCVDYTVRSRCSRPSAHSQRPQHSKCSLCQRTIKRRTAVGESTHSHQGVAHQESATRSQSSVAHPPQSVVYLERGRRQRNTGRKKQTQGTLQEATRAGQRHKRHMCTAHAGRT